MKRRNKRKNNGITFVGKAFLILLLSFFINIFSTLYLSTIITSTTISIQKDEKQIKILRQENEKLKYEIGELLNKERVIKIAQENGLNLNYDNVLTVKKIP